MDDLDLQELMDKQSITERLLDYARGVDRIDRELILSVFHEGAHLDYGAMFVGTGEEFADFIGVVHPAMEAHSHHLSNIYITSRWRSGRKRNLRACQTQVERSRRDTERYGFIRALH